MVTAAFASLALIGLVGAQVAGSPVVTEISWIDRPTLQPSDFPPAAFILGLSATVRMRCTANIDGAVTGCHTLDEPGAWGFEPGARASLERGRVAPRTEDGVPVVATFTTTIPFTHSEVDEPLVYAGPEPTTELVAYFRRILEQRLELGPDAFGMFQGLTAEQRDEFGPALRQAFDEHRADWLDAHALSAARQAPPEYAEAIQAGRAPPDLAFSMADPAAADRAFATDLRIRDRARAIYCERHACPPQN